MDSLAKMRDRWASTVLVDRPRARAICRLVRPSRTSRAISISRAVSRSSEPERCWPTVMVLIPCSPQVFVLCDGTTVEARRWFRVGRNTYSTGVFGGSLLPACEQCRQLHPVGHTELGQDALDVCVDRP